MKGDAFELDEPTRQTIRDTDGGGHRGLALQIDAADEGRAITAALEEGDQLIARNHARYAGVLAGRRGALEFACPFEDDALAAPWRTGRLAAERAALARACRSIDEAERIPGHDARRRTRADLDG